MMKDKNQETSDRSSEIREELLSIAPGLSDLDLKRAAGIPEGYFEQLPEKVSARLSAEAASTGRIRRLWIGVASAAAIALLGILLWWPAEPAESDLLADVSSEEAYGYVMANLDAYRDSDMLALLDADAVVTTFYEQPINDSEMDKVLEILSEEISENELNELFHLQNNAWE